MAIQKIKLGTKPHGDGGDSYRTANEKINSNFEQVGKDIGPLGRLITKNKDDVVGAINEVSGEIVNPKSLAKVDNTDYSPSKQDKQGTFVETFEDVRDVFFNSNMNELRISPPAIAECNIDLMDTLNDPARLGYTEQLNGTTLVIPICKFESSSVLSPFMPAPIRPSKIIDASITRFRLVDDKTPLHINLRGSMTVMLRVSKSTTASLNRDHEIGAHPMHVAELSVELRNLGDLGQESGSVLQLGTSYIGDAKPFKVYTLPNIIPFPLNYTNLEENIENNPEECLLPEIPLKFNQGRVPANSTVEELESNRFSVTSDWILVDDETILKLQATTSHVIGNRRLQFKDINGVITYDRTNQKYGHDVGTSDLLYIFPEAKYVRISFLSETAITPDEITATVTPVGPEADAFYGRWIKATINLGKMVTLLPERDYCLAISIWSKNKNWMGLDSKGLKVLSSNLNFNYDYSNTVKNLVNVVNTKEV